MNTERSKRVVVQIGSARLRPEFFLRKAREFAHVKAQGVSYPGRFLVLNVTPAPDGQLRLGLIVSRRYHRRAVQRNRARRLMRESYRLLRGGIAGPLWLVVIARPHMQGRQVQDVQAELIRLLRQAGAWQT